jgi:hypothetical protein
MLLSVRNALFLVLNLLMGIIGFFIGFRFILELVSANPSTPFVAWIYSVSSSLIYPFNGIISNPKIGFGTFDIVALIALLAYAIIFYIAEAVVDMVLRPRIYTDRERLV